MQPQEWFQRQLVAWKRFIATGEVEPFVRTEVAASWKRCRAAGLRHDAPKKPVRVSAKELEALRRTNREFIQAAIPFMRFLETAVRGSGFILVLTSRDGIVLEVFGDDEILRMARENNYVPGCCRTEQEVGTNAIGLSLVERRPIQITGPEHYNVRHHSWTCSSAPVFSPDGELLGAITLSGKSHAAHPHTLGMVISAAEAICDRLKQRQADTEKARMRSFVESLVNSISEAIISVDARGRVSHVNPLACRYLHRKPEQLKNKRLSELFPSSPEVARVLAAGEEPGPVEVRVGSGARAAYFMVKPLVLRGERGAQGAILMLSERRGFFRMLGGLGGYHARFTFADIKGRSPQFTRQLELARIAARTDSRVLIIGETGTGKELLAQAIHNASKRRDKPFVAINCAALPRDLIESELLGYKEGAFTGARKGGQIGKLELADGGTVFLDEVGEMPLDLQAKLLRVLEDGVITRLGDTTPIQVDIRLIAATNADLFEKVANNEFRRDLYFRLSVVEIKVPPLRERLEDLPELVGHILSRICTKLGRKITIHPDTLQQLSAYRWPGNVRELENVLEMAAIVCADGQILPAHLPERLRMAQGPSPTPGSTTPGSIREVELKLLKQALREANGNIAQAARTLKVSRSTIYRKMKAYGIDRSVIIS